VPAFCPPAKPTTMTHHTVKLEIHRMLAVVARDCGSND